jgi:hypothetical protein
MSAILKLSTQATTYQGDDRDGYWGRTVGWRLRETERLASRLRRLWLAPYVPLYTREQTDSDGWQTTTRGLVRASAIHAVRHWVGEYPREREACVAWRVLQLVAAAKQDDPTRRWADLATLAAWPVGLRLDAKRLRGRLGPLTQGTWCAACDDAPWASTTRLCLWCERQGAPPRAVQARPTEAAA